MRLVFFLTVFVLATANLIMAQPILMMKTDPGTFDNFRDPMAADDGGVYAVYNLNEIAYSDGNTSQSLVIFDRTSIVQGAPFGNFSRDQAIYPVYGTDLAVLSARNRAIQESKFAVIDPAGDVVFSAVAEDIATSKTINRFVRPFALATDLQDNGAKRNEGPGISAALAILFEEAVEDGEGGVELEFDYLFGAFNRPGQNDPRNQFRDVALQGRAERWSEEVLRRVEGLPVSGIVAAAADFITTPLITITAPTFFITVPPAGEPAFDEQVLGLDTLEEGPILGTEEGLFELPLDAIGQGVNDIDIVFEVSPVLPGGMMTAGEVDTFSQFVGFVPLAGRLLELVGELCGNADLDGDGSVTRADVRLVTRAYVQQDLSADVDGSGKINIRDIQIVATCLALEEALKREDLPDYSTVFFSTGDSLPGISEDFEFREVRAIRSNSNGAAYAVVLVNNPNTFQSSLAILRMDRNGPQVVMMEGEDYGHGTVTQLGDLGGETKRNGFSAVSSSGYYAVRAQLEDGSEAIYRLKAENIPPLAPAPPSGEATQLWTLH